MRWIRDLSCGDPRVYLAVEIRRVFGQSCGKVKQEKLGWLADNPLYTNRFAWYVGRRCRAAPSQAVARELRLDWHTVKEVEKQYRREQLRRAGMPGPRGIGSEESSIKKGHRYRLVVSDLERRRVRWCGGKERSEASMELFYQELGTKKSSKIRLAVMDLGKPFRTSTLKPQHAPHTAIRFDKFHGLRHLGEARDKVRQAEYRRLTGQDRQFSKGQKYTLLSRREHVTLEGRQALKTLLPPTTASRPPICSRSRLDSCGVIRKKGGRGGSLTIGGRPSNGNACSPTNSLPSCSSVMGRGLLPSATLRTKWHWGSWRASTTKSGSSNGAHMGCETKSICV